MKKLEITDGPTPWFKRLFFSYDKVFQEAIKDIPGTYGIAPGKSSPRWSWLVPIECMNAVTDLAKERGYGTTED